MFLTDLHTHSICSPDGYVPMAQMALAGHKAGLGAICLTDHCDFLSLQGEPTPHYDWSEPLKQHREMQREVGHLLRVQLGLEFGVPYLNPERAKAVLEQDELDFVIGSVHNRSARLGGGDFYFAPYETEADCYLALDDYFASMQILAESDFYDVLAHLTYPLRYMRGRYETPISTERYMEQIRVILKTAIEKGKGMEINTWKGQTLAEWIPLVKLYQVLGGEIITLGSDAHVPDAVGLGIPEAVKLLQDLDFPYLTIYEKRQPQFLKL